MKIPKTTPQLNRAELLSLLAQKHPELQLPAFAIIGIRGYYKNTMGKPDENDRAIYDDAIFILTENELHAFNANTDPSAYRAGIAKLNPGIYPAYRFDIHGGKKSQYPAICQRADKVTVTRDGGKVDTGMFGINIHKGGYNGTSSEGCQTLPPTQWDKFYLTAVRLAKSIYGDTYKSQTITYVLIEN